jgi:protein involved in polysaccharide export with SLBB domain
MPVTICQTRPTRTSRALKLLGCAGLALSLVGCAQKPANYAPIASIKAQAPMPLPPKGPYRLGAGDEVEVKFFFAPELNDRMLVRPDGKVSIMFAQDIQAAGLTAEELAADIRAVLAPHVKQLDLVVIVRNFASQKAYVGGEVGKPGPVTLSGSETLLHVLADAGWMTPAAGAEKVVLVRRDGSGEEKIYPVNVADLQTGHNMAQNVMVQPGDLILVPPSDAVSADRWVDQNIRQLLPFSTGFGLSYEINKN